MNEPVEAEEPVFGGKAAVIFAGVFLGGYAILAFLCARDHTHRAKLEHMTPLSAAIGEKK